MNNRIYSQEIFEREIEKLKMGLLYCPKCLTNNLTDKTGYFQLFIEYKCLNCECLFDRKLAIHKSDIRNMKIDKILNK